MLAFISPIIFGFRLDVNLLFVDSILLTATSFYILTSLVIARSNLLHLLVNSH